MSITGPSKYVKLFLEDISNSDPKGKVSDFVKIYKGSATFRGLVATLYPNIKVTV